MAKIRDGSTYLSQHLTANDYYCEQESVRGKWLGKGAERLGISGEINGRDSAFEALRENKHPLSGAKLTPRDRPDRVRFFDFQCSAQKSVSVMAITMGDSRLLEAHDFSARKAFGELEKFAATQANSAFTRGTRFTGNLVAAEFRHTASRALDPQVHSHFVVANATWDAETKSWRALTELEMVRSIRYAGKVYQNELAKACRELGYEIQQARDRRGSITGFEVVGVSDSIRRRFSKRRAEVEKGVSEFEARNGRAPTTAEVHAITVRTRDPKLKEVTTAEVLTAQRGQLTQSEFADLSRVKESAVCRIPDPPMPTRERESVRIAAAHLFERRSVVSGHELMAEALNTNLGHLDLRKLQQHTGDAGLVALGDRELLRESFAGERGLRQEIWATQFISNTNGRFEALGRIDEVAVEGLLADQRKVAEGLLASRDQIVSLRGAAGVGKTTTLRALVRCLEKSGHAVSVCAPTSSAADTLRSEKVANAQTVSAFLLQPHTHGDVWVVDEAGLVSNNQGIELLQKAAHAKARVIFLGDSRQHVAVEAGDFVRVLEEHAPLRKFELTDIRRQLRADYRSAVKEMALGDVRGGLEQLDALGWIKDSQQDYIRFAVQDYLRLSANGNHTEAVLAVTPTWEENVAFTAALRNELKTQGHLRRGEVIEAHEPMQWTKAQMARSSNYAAGMILKFERASCGFRKGDRVVVTSVGKGHVHVDSDRGPRRIRPREGGFNVSRPVSLEICAGDKLLARANDKTANVINGEVFTVAEMCGGIITTADGRAIDTKQFASLAHGFAVTSHRSQSKTAEHVVVAAARLDAKAAYVACSRGRSSCTLHTPDKNALLGGLPSGERKAALDVVEPAELFARALKDTPARACEEQSHVPIQALGHIGWRAIFQSLCGWSRGWLPWCQVDGLQKVRGRDIA